MRINDVNDSYSVRVGGPALEARAHSTAVLAFFAVSPRSAIRQRNFARPCAAPPHSEELPMRVKRKAPFSDGGRGLAEAAGWRWSP